MHKNFPFLLTIYVNGDKIDTLIWSIKNKGVYMDNYDELEKELLELESENEEEDEQRQAERTDENSTEEENFQRKRGQRSLHSLDLYLDDLYSYDMVSQEQINEWAYARDNATNIDEYLFYRNKIVEHNVRLVVSIAKRYEKDSEKLVDMIGAGHAGLITAAEKYDPSKGYHFSTFATWWIRQAITRERDETRGTIRLPVHAVEKLSRISRYRDEIYKTTGSFPSINEIAKAFNLSPETVSLYLRQGSVDSLNRSVADEEKDTPLQDMIADTSINVEREVIKNLEKEKLNEYLQKILKPRECFILRKRYGLEDGETYSLEEVGRMVGVTRERIRQLEAKAIRKLRMNRSFRNLFKNIA